MTQADFTIANQTFPNTRTELNTSLYSDLDNPINSNIAFGGGYTEEPIPIIPTACGTPNALR